MTTSIRTALAALAIAATVVPVTAASADAATKHHRQKTKRVVTAKKTTKPAKPVATVALAPAATPAPVSTPAPAPAPTVNSVIAIGGYVFYNLTYAEAVEAYQAAVAAAPAGYTPPPVTSISVTTTVGN